MKITTNPGSIIAACDAVLRLIQAERETEDAASAKRSAAIAQMWWARLLRFKPPFTPSVRYQEQKNRIFNLRAIAKHKAGTGIIEVEDPYLSDIAMFLEPYESARI